MVRSAGARACMPLLLALAPCTRSAAQALATSVEHLPGDRFNCQEDLATWWQIWHAEKRAWCCSHRLQCPELPASYTPPPAAYTPPPKASTSEPKPPSPSGRNKYDCREGLSTWWKSWDSKKKKWCCAHQVDCPSAPAGGADKQKDDAEKDHKEYKCKEGHPEKWDQEQSDYCCFVRGIGCDERSAKHNESHHDRERHHRQGEALDAHCFQHGTFYQPINMHGQDRTREHSLRTCQRRCRDTEGCAHFSWWVDGGCHLQDRDAVRVYDAEAISGRPDCEAHLGGRGREELGEEDGLMTHPGFGGPRGGGFGSHQSFGGGSPGREQDEFGSRPSFRGPRGREEGLGFGAGAHGHAGGILPYGHPQAGDWHEGPGGHPQGRAAHGIHDRRVFPVCVEHGVSFEPIDMQGTSRKVTKSSAACQEYCEDTPHCAHFTWWPDGGCHLQSARAKRVHSSDAISGQPFCKAEEKEIVAYQEAGWCGSQGDDHKFSRYCTSSMGRGKCMSTIHVSHEACPSGIAHLHSLKNHVWMNWCFYWHVAQYFCADKAEAHMLLRRRDDHEREEGESFGDREHRYQSTGHKHEQYDCVKGPWSAKDEWSHDRQAWCCQHRQVCSDPGDVHALRNDPVLGHLQKKAQQLPGGVLGAAAGYPLAFSLAFASALCGIAAAAIGIRARGGRGISCSEEERALALSILPAEVDDDTHSI